MSVALEHLDHMTARARIDRHCEFPSVQQPAQHVELFKREVRTSDGDRIDAVGAVGGGQASLRVTHHLRRDRDALIRGAEVQCDPFFRRFRRCAGHVKQAHRSRRGRGRAERFEDVFPRPEVQAAHDADGITDQAPVQVAENRPRHVRVQERRVQSRYVEHYRGAAVLRAVQPVIRRAAGDGACDVEKIAVAIRAGAEHGVAERDRVRLAPRDLRAKARPMPRLIRSAGPRLLAAKRTISRHHPGRHRVLVLRQPVARTPHQVDRADVQGRSHRHLRAAFHQPLCEQRSRITVIQRAVDVRRLDRDELRRAHQPRSLRHDAHRHGGAFAQCSAGDRSFFWCK